MDLSTQQIKDTYGNLVTVGDTAGTPSASLTLQNGAGTALTNIDAGVFTLPMAICKWTTNYFNIGYSTDVRIPFDIMSGRAVPTTNTYYEFANAGTNDARVKILKSGWYLVLGAAHFFDLGGNNQDVTVKLHVGTAATGVNPVLVALADKRLNEGSTDQLMNGWAILDIEANNYIYMTVNASNGGLPNSPYPSNSDNTPTSMNIIKISDKYP